jgi:hypothetical protein
MSETKTVVRYDNNYLQQYCKENGIELLKDYSKEKVNIYTIIEGKCVNCDNNFSKGMKPLCINGGVCKKCGIKMRMEKIKCKNKDLYGVEYALQSSTIKDKIKIQNLEKYGVENQFQLEETKNKIKKTNLEKYGVEHPLQNTSIKTKIKTTCLEKYGVENPNQNAEIRQKTIKTCLEKYGVECPLQSQDVKDKIKDACLEKYGVEHPSQTEENKIKHKKTCLEKYGVECPLQSQDVKDKIKQTNLEKYGVENPSQSENIKNKKEIKCLYSLGVKNPFQSEEVKDKIKQTNLEKYGVEYAQQNSEVAEKSSKNAYKSKDYIFPSGRIERIQGYEHYMLSELLQQENILEDDILVSRKEVPSVWYEDANGTKRRYFVDCFIKSQNRCIETKSTWTAEKKKDCIFLKQQALKDAGYKCEIWVYNSKGEKVECYK